MSTPNKRFIFEGLIGAGKTSTIQCLASLFRDVTINIKPYKPKMMDSFYNGELESIFVQKHFFDKLSDIHLNPENFGLELLDRSLIGNLAFTICLYMRGELDIEDFEKEITAMDNIIVNSFNPDRDVIIYLNTPIHTSYGRVKSRNRNFEENLDIFYMIDVYRAYMFTLIYLLSHDIPIKIVDTCDGVHKTTLDIFKIYNKESEFYDEYEGRKTMHSVREITNDLGICFAHQSLIDILKQIKPNYAKDWSLNVAEDVNKYLYDIYSI